MVLVCLTFSRSLAGGFLWDDDSHITANPLIIGPLGLREVWTTAEANYFPLVLTNFWIQHALWGLNPAGYHAVTILCHAATAFLLWRLLRRLGVPGAWLGAAAWAVHPVQVESVAWICELKNTQSGIFFLASAICFTRWLRGTEADDRRTSSLWGRRVQYGAALALAVLALLSKPSTVMLPVVLLLIAWRAGRFSERRVMWRLLPFFALSLLAGGWTIWEQKFHSGATGVEWSQSWHERLLIAGRVIWFYLGKLVWPHPLIFIYPRWDIGSERWLGVLCGLAAILVLGALLFSRRSAVRGCFFPAAYFVALLFPVAGFFNVYFFRYSFVGDHLQYLASMGPLALMGTVIARLQRGRFFIGAGLVAGLALLSANECGSFRDNLTLWRVTARRNPSATLAWENLGALAVKEGRLDDARSHYRRALELKPDDYEALTSLGSIHLVEGQLSEAQQLLETAIRFDPTRPEAPNTLGYLAQRKGDFGAAESSYRAALKAQPDFADALSNLGGLLNSTGRSADAVPFLESAVRRDPQSAKAQHNLGNALRQTGRLAEAITRYEEALRLDPRLAETHEEIGMALAASGRIEPAIAHYRQAILLAPQLETARLRLGLALTASGQYDEALAQLDAVLRGNPRDGLAELARGQVLAALNRWPEAGTALKRAVELLPDSAEARANLAMALANLGALDESVAQFEAAIRLAPNNPVHHEGLARVLSALGRAPEAEGEQARAASLRRDMR